MIKPNMTYTAHHRPTGESWVILGINEVKNEVCAAGWPPSIGKLYDCTNLQERSVRTAEERTYMVTQFGPNWN